MNKIWHDEERAVGREKEGRGEREGGREGGREGKNRYFSGKKEREARV